MLNDALKLRLQAQPIEGKANDALIRYVADVLKVAKSTVSITHGHTSKRKMIVIGVPGLTVEAVIQGFLPPPIS